MMDPSWESCPYCDAQRKSNQQTRVAGASSAQGAEPVVHAPDRTRTSTRQMGSVPAPDAKPSKRSDAPRLVGFMVTYTWRPEGQHFPLFEGKNYIGAGNVSSEAPHRECDIHLTDDEDMSSEHALILYRQGGFVLFDQQSTNGTYVGDEMIPLQGIELADDVSIRTGNTRWIFMKIPNAGGTASSTDSPSQAASDPAGEPTATAARATRVD